MAETKDDDIKVNDDGTFVEQENIKPKHTARNVALIVFAVVVVAAIVFAIIGSR